MLTDPMHSMLMRNLPSPRTRETILYPLPWTSHAPIMRETVLDHESFCLPATATSFWQPPHPYPPTRPR